MKRAITTLAIMAAMMAIVVGVPTVKYTAASLPVVHAQDTGSGCSLSSLKGSYGLDRQGTLVSSILGLPAPAPWTEVAFEHFDRCLAGSYTINSDCTGTKTVNTSVGVTVHEAIIVTGGGQRMIGTQTDPWAVVQTRAEKIGE